MQRLFYPKSFEDLFVPPRKLRALNKRRCVVCGLPGEWSPPDDNSKVLCIQCAEGWKCYQKEWKLYKWFGVANWRKEFERQFIRFLNYYRAFMRNTLDTVLEKQAT